MRRFYLHIVVLFLLFAPMCSAQIVLTDEDKELTFQNYFFEALKQKALQNYSKAVENLEKCYELDSTQLVVSFELSQNFLKLKRYFEAEQFIKKALSKDPGNEYMLLHKSKIYSETGNFEQAIAIQKELAARLPKYNEELLELFMQSRQYERAAALIETMETKALSTNRSKIYKQFLENRFKKPETEVQKQQEESESPEVLRKRFTDTKDYNVLKQLLEMEERNELYEMMAADSEEGIALFPAQPLLYLIHAKAQFALGKYNEAIDVLGIGIDFVIENPDMERAFYNELAKNYEELNDFVNARKFKEKAAKIRQQDK